MKYPLLAAVLLIVLVCGCTGQPSPVGTSDCHSLDGTWTGTISDSGSLTVTRTDIHGNDYTTHNPFTASYDLEMTIKCAEDISDGVWSYDITHAKASHPIFDCAAGCTPLLNSHDAYRTGSMFFMRNNGTGWFAINFPNGAYIFPFGYDEGNLQVSPDGKKMQVYLPGGGSEYSIGWTGEKNDMGYRDIETDNCKRLGGEGNCYIEDINKNTMWLTKVS